MPSEGPWDWMWGNKQIKGPLLIQFEEIGMLTWPPLMELQSWHPVINTLRMRQNGWHFADDTFKSSFLNENVWISLKISLKFVPKVQINNIPALIQIMAWCWLGDKPLSELMMLCWLILFTEAYICVTLPQWVKSNHCKSFGDLVPVDKIYWHNNFKWIVVT